LLIAVSIAHKQQTTSSITIMDSAPTIIKLIHSLAYSSLPSEDVLFQIVKTVVPIAKIMSLLTIVSVWSASKSMPFSRNIYKYAFMGAIAKLVHFSLPYGDTDMGSKLESLFEDLSFVLPLMGVIVTTGLDFLWALSSSIDSDILFRRNISEYDFVVKFERIQPIVTIFLVFARYAPNINVEGLVFAHLCFAVWLVTSYGFIWFCLWKVAGASETKRFQDAYHKSFAITAFVSSQILLYLLVLFPCVYDAELCRKFILVTHLLETLAIFALVAFFAFFKAPPADLQANKMNWTQMSGVMKAKAKLKAKKASNKSD